MAYCQPPAARDRQPIKSFVGVQGAVFQKSPLVAEGIIVEIKKKFFPVNELTN